MRPFLVIWFSNNMVFCYDFQFFLAIEFQLFPGQSRDLHAGHGRSSFSLRFDSCSSLWVLGHYLQLLAVQYAKLLGLGLWDWAWSAWLAIADWPGTTQFAESQGEETARCYQWYVKSPRPFSWPFLKYSWPLSFFSRFTECENHASLPLE